MRAPWRRRLMHLGIAALACAVVLGLEIWRPNLMNRFDEGLRDFFLQIVADPQAEMRVVVVDISDAAIREMGPWPWPRSRMADLVEILLTDYGARAVGLDIVFPEPHDADGDARLAALGEHAPLALAQIFDFTPRFPSVQLGLLTGAVKPPAHALPLVAHGFVANHAQLGTARCVGNIGYAPDPDGVLRHTPVVTTFQGQAFLHLAASLLACADPHPSANLRLPLGNAQGLWRIPYRHRFEAYTVIPAGQVLRGEVATALIRGRYVLVGSSSLNLGDRISTPLAPLVSGVMVHAQSVSALLDEVEGIASDYRDGRLWLLAWAVLSIGVAVFWIGRLSAWGGALLLLALGCAWLGMALWGVREQIEWSITSPLCGYLFLLLVAVPFEWRQSQREAQHVTETLSHYVARPVLDELRRRGLTYSLEPQLREVTVLIADMQDYTRMTSSLSLEEAAQLTKGFLDCLTRPVLAHGGTLDKYSGDGLVAFWGAPLLCPDQADQAVSAALEILRDVEVFNANRVAQGMAAVRVRIGIESGQALVGDLGTPFRSTYTAVGNCINFASRLEAAARDLPTQLLIGSAANANLVKHHTKPLGKITLRGTQTTIEVFTAPTGAI